MFKFAIQTDNGHEEETRLGACNYALRDQFGNEWKRILRHQHPLDMLRNPWKYTGLINQYKLIQADKLFLTAHQLRGKDNTKLIAESKLKELEKIR